MTPPAEGEETGQASTDRPWLLTLATRQLERAAGPSQVYSESTQMAHLRVPGEPVAIDSGRPPTTKKADRETGEDQKGF
jgi:hypothetical protein